MYSDSVLDSSGYGRISDHDATNGHLKYAVDRAIHVEYPRRGRHSRKRGAVHLIGPRLIGQSQDRLLRCDEYKPQVRFRRESGGSAWDLETADVGGALNNDVGSYASISLDPSSQKVRIMYYDATALGLKYALQQ